MPARLDLSTPSSLNTQAENIVGEWDDWFIHFNRHRRLISGDQKKVDIFFMQLAMMFADVLKMFLIPERLQLLFSL